MEKAEGGDNIDEIVPYVVFTERLPFNVAVTVLAFLNIVIIGLEMDFGPGPSAGIVDRMMWFVVEVVFATWFVIETVIRICNGRHAYVSDIWNVLDCLLVFGNVLDLFVLKPLSVGGYVR